MLSLGLTDLGPFDPRHKVIEYRYAGRPPGLAAMTLRDFRGRAVEQLPRAGGGSVAALCGALSASLSCDGRGADLVRRRAWSRRARRWRPPDPKPRPLKDWFLDAVDRDTDGVQRRARRRAHAEAEPGRRCGSRRAPSSAANQSAAKVPLDVLEATIRALELSLRVAKDGNPNSVSDAGVAGACALAAAEGAALNVRINAPSLTDRVGRRRATSRVRAARSTRATRAGRPRCARPWIGFSGKARIRSGE